jgi:hypothetical protein
MSVCGGRVGLVSSYFLPFCRLQAATKAAVAREWLPQIVHEISLFRVLGGTLRSQKPQSTGDRAKYSLELTAKVHGIPATSLNLLIALLTRLAEAGGAVESLHLNVEPLFSTTKRTIIAMEEGPALCLAGARLLPCRFHLCPGESKSELDNLVGNLVIIVEDHHALGSAAICRSTAS